jgi:hypothetical protein
MLYLCGMKTNDEKIKEHLDQIKNLDEVKNADEIQNHFIAIKELRKKDREEKVYQYWLELKEPFVLDNDIPALPNPLTDFYIGRLIELGAIPKDKLEDDVWYYGDTRNANVAQWDAKNELFIHWRYKFGWMKDDVKHFQDDNGFALFVPIRKATEEEIKEQEAKC